MENSYELIRRIYRPKTIHKYQNKAKLLGEDDKKRVISFLNTRLIVSILIFAFLFLTSDLNYIVAPIGTLIFYLGFAYFSFDYRINKRVLKLEKEAMFFFEILSLSLESGKNLIQALTVATTNVDSELSLEFKRALQEIEYGKSFHDAFQSLKNRIPSDIIQNIILNIIDSYTTGGNIVSTLNKQVKFVRNKRVMDIKARINQIPIKISVISVFLFIPLVLLMLLAPVILEYFLG